MAQEDLQKKVDLAFLSAFYGGLLTEKQRRVLSLHCEEDLSLGEIAADVGISRQAVHELILRSERQLNEYEEKLGLLERFRRMKAALNLCESRLESAKQALDEAEDALRQIKED